MASAAASIVALVIALILLVVGYINVLGASADAMEAHTSLHQMEAQERSLERAASQASATRSERPALNALVIPAGGGAQFIAGFDALAKTAGVVFEILSVSAEPPQGTLPGSLTLVLRFSGTYAACEHFMRLVETLPRSTAIKALTLAYNDGAKSWDGTLTVATLSFDTP